MASSELADLTATTVLAADDLLYVVKDPSGTPLDRKITGATLRLGVGWRLADSWTHSVNVTEVDFDVSALSALLVVVRAVTLSVSGRIQIRVSTDGGVTFHTSSGDYVSVVDAGTETNLTGLVGYTGDATAARSAIFAIPVLGATGGPKVMQVYNRSTTNGAFSALFVASTDPITDIRLVPTNAGDLTGGAISVFGQ